LKIAIVGDTHFGARNSNQTVQYWQDKFWTECFWPYMDKNKITHIIQTGDYFDNRKWINLQTMAFQKKMFVEEVQKRDITCYGIIGNHDIPLRYSLENNSPGQILNHENNIHFYDECTTIELDGIKFTLMPWICKDNNDEYVDIIKRGGEVLIGHYEIDGMLMHPGHTAKAELKVSDFENWKYVISGHYHTMSEKGNINYVGTPYQMNWNDADSKHGFWVMDTTDLSMEFIENTYSYFHKIYWDDGTNYNMSTITNAYVKLVVKKKTDFEQFEKFIDQINFANPFELKIIESFEEYSEDNVGDIIKMVATTDLISEYIEDVATDNNKEAIKKLMLEIYDDALRIDELDNV
jgi:DNA repair exonuclease SbcCD nuclease subunit|tara:strand:+ start:214 stop:1263 length:1050 start_codon:yes stop_codon:yes gene_type:complete